jgi:hypothetical protein
MVPVPTFAKSYGSGSYFCKKLRFRFLLLQKVTVPVPAPYLDHKQIIKINFGIFFDFLLGKLFYKEKVHEFQQIYGKM